VLRSGCAPAFASKLFPFVTDIPRPAPNRRSES
jgi:hypothetical protein